jgi:hypothetical protein
MRKLVLCVAALLTLSCPGLTYSQAANPRIYIAPANGLESFLAGAFTKKNVPDILNSLDNLAAPRRHGLGSHRAA